MNLTLITVNFNNTRLTIDLLRSLERQTERNFDIIVVDNDSSSVERTLLGSYAVSSPLRLDIIYSDTNRGFSGGNNFAIRKALAQGSQWMLLMNNDTTVQTDFVALLPLEHPGLIGLPIGEGERIAFAGMVQWFVYTLAHYYRPTTSPNAYPIGAGMLIHQSVFEMIGFLDERYFLYFEDADFSLRARKAGISIFFVQYPIITHLVSSTTKQLGSPLLLRYHSRNALLFHWTQGPWWVRTLLPFWSFFSILRQLFKALTLPSLRQDSLALAVGIVDFYARKFGKIKNSSHRN